MKNRKGIIKINQPVIEQNKEDLLEVFRKFIPVTIDINMLVCQSIYWGYSPEFRELKEGEAIPEYEVLLTRNEDGSITSEFKEL